MTNNLPEMRASDAEREEVTETLRQAVAEGRLDMEEFDERLGSALKARTRGELATLISDLPAEARSAAAPARVASGWPERMGGQATSSGAFAVWGGFARRGHWTVGRTFTAFTLWGGGVIDLREAHFEEAEVDIRCFALFGGMSVVVPPDLECQVKGIGILGGFGDRASGPGTPGSPRVRVTGLALFGGIGAERKERKAVKAAAKAARKSLA
ncbi:DUF1707 domain-containing protein [Streptomyces sp. NBC_00536]|uniref:DUF1707 SHOCT-like domain-containing protein n=1 Tax=Streptomyces sp. NBC_00536 TaxID=2975769 RepID=UPI002E80392A|nr:DUF1707 domain-containing protein [Streptomyces sp. NBC_00536]WUC79660.1 DUF1707 domain-containing protein [Streptomyces sp. NBC_00536]